MELPSEKYSFQITEEDKGFMNELVEEIRSGNIIERLNTFPSYREIRRTLEDSPGDEYELTCKIRKQIMQAVASEIFEAEINSRIGELDDHESEHNDQVFDPSTQVDTRLLMKDVEERIANFIIPVSKQKKSVEIIKEKDKIIDKTYFDCVFASETLGFEVFGKKLKAENGQTTKNFKPIGKAVLYKYKTKNNTFVNFGQPNENDLGRERHVKYRRTESVFETEDKIKLNKYNLNLNAKKEFEPYPRIEDEVKYCQNNTKGQSKQKPKNSNLFVFGKVPMKDRKGPFFVDESIVNVQLYQEGLMFKQWNPTQVVYEICSQCEWPLPVFSVICNSVGKLLFSVYVKGHEFKGLRAQSKKLAKHSASACFLKFLGFKFA